MKNSFFLLASIILFVSCGTPAPKQSQSTEQDSLRRADSMAQIEVLRAVEYNSLNQTARFIAGIRHDGDSLFALQNSTPAWQQYSLRADSAWTEFHAKNAKMEQWARTTIHPRSAQVKSVFYPFSGPDFLHLNIFFPNVQTLYMLGLEPLGSVPQVADITPAQVERYVDTYRESIGEITDISYYRTKSMYTDVNNFSVDGVTPVAMIFLARAGKYILSVDTLTLNEHGEPIVVRGQGKTRNRGVQIAYRTPEDTITRKLIYFTGNIEDNELARNETRKKFIQNIKCEGGFSKSASYLMHYASFATVRNAMLDGCRLIVSDDTGIAYKFYDPTKWNIELYGTYTRPVFDFPHIFEEDLKAAYQDSSLVRGDLDFRFGYNRKSNMRVMTKK